jgi:hypothetical protein
MLGNYRVAAQLVASRVVLSSIELVRGGNVRTVGKRLMMAAAVKDEKVRTRHVARMGLERSA